MTRNTRARTRFLLALPIAAIALSLAACSGAGERPSVDKLSEGLHTVLQDSGQGDLLTLEQIDCISEKFLASPLSDQDLANIADGKDLQTSQEAKDLVTATMSQAAGECSTP